MIIYVGAAVLLEPLMTRNLPVKSKIGLKLMETLVSDEEVSDGLIDELNCWLLFRLCDLC